MELVMGQDAKGRGNIMYKVVEGDATYLLKLYRSRWNPLQEHFEKYFARYAHRRTSGSAIGRYESERDNLQVWTEAGFDVCRVFDKPLPEGVEPPGLWLEYCPGPTLSEFFVDPDVDEAQKTSELTRMVRGISKRHALAMATGERRLLQKHPTCNHLLLHEGRQVTIDLEGAYLPNYRMLEALTREVSGYLRSFRRGFTERIDQAIDVFAAEYTEKELLKQIVDWGVHGASIYRRLTRLQDRSKRGAEGKTALLARLRDRL
ncbi:MAG: hypothetical protein ACYTG5_18455 [Planctomycetota bacterium]|jgi:hypothetical protein